MLEVRDLLVQYGAVPALHGVSLKVGERSITSIVGSNGAGKSSILRTIMGHEQAAEGEILFRNEKISGLPAHTICRKGISLVPEGRGLFTKLTVQENLMLGAFAVKNREAVEEAKQWIYDLFPLLRERIALRGYVVLVVRARSPSHGSPLFKCLARSVFPHLLEAKHAIAVRRRDARSALFLQSSSSFVVRKRIRRRHSSLHGLIIASLRFGARL